MADSMRTSIGLLAALLFVAGGCQFAHRMPLKEIYDEVRVGEAIPDGLSMPREVGSEVRREGAWAAMMYHRWENATGAMEWVVFRIEQGKVIGKRYQVRGEEGQLAVDRYHRLDRSDWEIQGRSDRPANVQQIRDACQAMEFARQGLPITSGRGFMDGRLRAEPDAEDISAEPVLKIAEGNNAAKTGRLQVDESTREHPYLPFFVHRKLQLQQNDDGLVQVVVEWEINASLSAWTALGWSRMLQGNPPD
ncbi:MAG: hypothetical protein ACHRHE_04195 [Tepidisphaerales bacterium]